MAITGRLFTGPASTVTVTLFKNWLPVVHIWKPQKTGEGRLFTLPLCMDSHPAVVQELVASGAKLEATDNNGWTPLHSACLQGNLAVVQDLVFRGANLEAVDNEGRTPLHRACQGGELAVVEYLLTALGANSFCTRDNTGALPLHSACRVGAPVEILRLLVQAYAAALQTTDNNGDRPLHAACQADAPSLDVIRFVVEQDPNAVQAANNDGALPIHLLCGSRPSLDAIRFVAQQDPTALQAANNDGALPLHLLCGSRPSASAQTVQFLVSLFEGALARRTHRGDLPLMVACNTSSSESVLQVLLVAYPEALLYMQEFYNPPPQVLQWQSSSDCARGTVRILAVVFTPMRATFPLSSFLVSIILGLTEFCVLTMFDSKKEASSIDNSSSTK